MGGRAFAGEALTLPQMPYGENITGKEERLKSDPEAGKATTVLDCVGVV